jgi:hypothetical protein
MNTVVHKVLETQPNDDDNDNDDNLAVLSFRQKEAAHLLSVIRSVFISFSSLEVN